MNQPVTLHTDGSLSPSGGVVVGIGADYSDPSNATSMGVFMNSQVFN